MYTISILMCSIENHQNPTTGGNHIHYLIHRYHMYYLRIHGNDPQPTNICQVSYDNRVGIYHWCIPFKIHTNPHSLSIYIYEVYEYVYTYIYITGNPANTHLALGFYIVHPCFIFCTYFIFNRIPPTHTTGGVS